MPINQFNDYPWERREANDAADRYEQRIDDRYDRSSRRLRGEADWDEITQTLLDDDGYREWCETIEKQFEQWENR